MHRGGGSSLSGSAWLSVSRVLATVVCGCVKVQSQVINRRTERGQAYLLVKRDGTTVFFVCVREEQLEGKH